MNNADRIRNMTDEQLQRFLWTWKINSVTLFLTQGGANSQNARDIGEWLKTDEWVCPENEVGEDFVYNQDFELKESE